MPLLPGRDDDYHYGNAVSFPKGVYAPLHSLCGFVMIMQPVYRKQMDRKGSSMSQREGMSHRPIFEYTRLPSAHYSPVIQLTGPIKCSPRAVPVFCNQPSPFTIPIGLLYILSDGSVQPVLSATPPALRIKHYTLDSSTLR